MYERQNGNCAICNNNYPVLNIDHDHETGKVRALLCGECNRGLGFFHDNLELLKKGIDYLETYK
jgi:hypothetical protein